MFPEYFGFELLSLLGIAGELQIDGYNAAFRNSPSRPWLHPEWNIMRESRQPHDAHQTYYPSGGSEGGVIGCLGSVLLVLLLGFLILGIGTGVWKGAEWVISSISDGRSRAADRQSVSSAPSANGSAFGEKSPATAASPPIKNGGLSADAASMTKPAGTVLRDVPKRPQVPLKPRDDQAAAVAKPATPPVASEPSLPTGRLSPIAHPSTLDNTLKGLDDSGAKTPEKTIPSAMRQWQDTPGGPLRASLLEYRDGSVQLGTAEGKVYWVPMRDLAKADRQFILQSLRGKGDLGAGPNRSTLQVRTWIDSSGKYRVQAALISVRDDQVELLKEDGDLVIVPFSRLRQGDRDYARVFSSVSTP